MPACYDIHAPKRSANLSINGDLLAKAKSLGVNLSATLEQALSSAVQEQQRAQWLAENRDAIAGYNAQVEQHGVFSDGQRSF